jgi:putative ABC transport system substrate-binding protein
MRFALIVGIVIAIFAAFSAADAQQAKKARLIGILSPPEPLTSIDFFRRELQNLGYTEDNGTRIEYRSSEGYDDRFAILAADLVALKVDILIAVTPPAIRAAQLATTSIPIVMVLSGDPVANGLIKSLARPGGNTTGAATLTYDLSPKRLEIFKECVPNLKEIAVLVNPSYPGTREALTQMQVAGRRWGLTVRSFEVREAAEVDRALTEISRSRADGLFVEPSPLTSTYMTQIIAFATTNRLPAIDARKEFPERGGLMSYGIDYADHVRAGLRYVDKILRGAKPADLPVEQPTKFELVINLKTAKLLGLTVPQSLLLRADKVIE